MKRHILINSFLISFLFILNSGCTSSQPRETWHQSMQKLSELMSELMPSIVNQKYELSSAEQTKIRSLTTRLSGLSHGISQTTTAPSRDPSLRFAAREFKNEVQQIEQLMDQNRWQEVKPHLARISQYCISCHTQNHGGSSAYSINLKPNLSGFTDFDKATYFTSVRQFEQAIIFYENALTNEKWASENPQLWNKGIVQLFAIITRVKRDPNLLLEMISRFFDTKSYPQDLKDSAKIWREYAKKWEKEKPAAVSISSIEFNMRSAQKKYKNSTDAMVLYLRNSADLNELLHSDMLNTNDQQTAFYFSGQIAEALPDLSYLGFASDYYQTCADILPKTKLGRTCLSKVK